MPVNPPVHFKAVRRLTESERQLLVSLNKNGMSYRQAAKLMDCSAATVHNVVASSRIEAKRKKNASNIYEANIGAKNSPTSDVSAGTTNQNPRNVAGLPSTNSPKRDIEETKKAIRAISSGVSIDSSAIKTVKNHSTAESTSTQPCLLKESTITSVTGPSKDQGYKDTVPVSTEESTRIGSLKEDPVSSCVRAWHWFHKEREKERERETFHVGA